MKRGLLVIKWLVCGDDQGIHKEEPGLYLTTVNDMGVAAILTVKHGGLTIVPMDFFVAKPAKQFQLLCVIFLSSLYITHTFRLLRGKREGVVIFAYSAKFWSTVTRPLYTPDPLVTSKDQSFDYKRAHFLIVVYPSTNFYILCHSQVVQISSSLFFRPGICHGPIIST